MRFGNGGCPIHGEPASVGGPPAAVQLSPCVSFPSRSLKAPSLAERIGDRSADGLVLVFVCHTYRPSWFRSVPSQSTWSVAPSSTSAWPGTERWVEVMEAGPPADWLPRSQWHLCWLVHDKEDAVHREGLRAALDEGESDEERPGVASALWELVDGESGE